MNRLDKRPRHVLAACENADLPSRRAAASADRAEHQRLLKEWGTLNGLKLCNEAFGPRILAGLNVRSCMYDVQGDAGTILGNDFYQGWPGRDHETLFHRDKRPAAIVVEPYDGDGDNVRLGGADEVTNTVALGDIREYLKPLGLVIRTPPNPYASFWYPGFTRFVVITRPDFGPVHWLPEQLEYEGSPGAGFGLILAGRLAERSLVHKGS